MRWSNPSQYFSTIDLPIDFPDRGFCSTPQYYDKYIGILHSNSSVPPPVVSFFEHDICNYLTINQANNNSVNSIRMIDVRMRDLPPHADRLSHRYPIATQTPAWIMWILSQLKRLRGSCGLTRPTDVPEKLPTVAVYHDSLACQYRLEVHWFRVACEQILLLPMLCSRVHPDSGGN
jgi:hypothetical protein